MEITIEKKVRPIDDKGAFWIASQSIIEISDEDLLKIHDRILELRGEQDDEA